MRYYFAHILESFREDYPKGSTICYKGYSSAHSSKGSLMVMTVLDVNNPNSNPEAVATTIGLGYADFKNEEDYKARGVEVIKKKLKEVGVVEEETMKNKELVTKVTREEFITAIRHIGWCYYQIAAGQPYNEEPNEDQIKSLLDGIKYADEHPGMTPEQNHENWMKMKVSQGWKCGPIKDFNKKEHPDMVPFDQLPDIEKRKDIADYIGHRLASTLWERL